jgi:hypothetical protein
VAETQAMARSIDNPKFDHFNPSSLDVIFHDCKIAVKSQGIRDAFAG